jgi:hypothetical protein
VLLQPRQLKDLVVARRPEPLLDRAAYGEFEAGWSYSRRRQAEDQRKSSTRASTRTGRVLAANKEKSREPTWRDAIPRGTAPTWLTRDRT